MTATLILNSNNAQNPLSLDLSNYLDLTDGTDINPQDPAFTTRVISHSLLKEGGVLALSDYQAKELVFPLRISAASNVALQTIIEQINQVVNSPGATYSWQPPGASQPTIFDSISGQFDVHYRYREDEAKWCSGDLKLFTQPFGHAGGPRSYATASGVGPLLMVTPYASGGGQAIGASTQAGIAGYGAIGQGGTPSSGVFYWGSPSLVGDAPALLQLSYAGPQPTGATNAGVVPTVAVSVLPDANYQPLIPTTQVLYGASKPITNAVVPASQYLTMAGPNQDTWSFGFAQNAVATLDWAGPHRLFAIARASGQPGTLALLANSLVVYSASIGVGMGDWQALDLGTFQLAGSQTPQQAIAITAAPGASTNAALDLAAFVVLPDSKTWFMSPSLLTPSQYGPVSSPNEAFITGANDPAGVAVDGSYVYWTNVNANSIGRANLNGIDPTQWWIAGANGPYGIAQDGHHVYWANSGGNANTIGRQVKTGGMTTQAAFSNTVLIDDYLSQQFLFANSASSYVPSAAGIEPQSTPITAYTRGLVPRPEPSRGLPILAIFAVGQNSTPSQGGSYQQAGASWTNQQNLATYAQINVIERTRYVLP